jgi:virginiamycin B lyase
VLIAAAVLVGLGVFGVIRSRQHTAAPAGPVMPSPQPVHTTTYTLHPVRSGAVSGWKLPVHLSGPRGIAVDATGMVWVAEQDKGAVDMFNGTQLTRYPEDAAAGATGAFLVARGPGTSMWFTGYPSGVVGRVYPNSYMNTFNAIATTTLGIAMGPGGDMWITDFQGAQIVRIEQSGPISRYDAAPPPGMTKSSPRDIVEGSDQNMWFTNTVADAIGKVSTGATPTVTEYPVGKGTQPRSIALAPDGSIWATLAHRELAKIDEGTGSSTIVKLPAVDENLNAIAVAQDGTIWLTGEGPWVYHVNADGSLIKKYKLPSGAKYADEIAIDGQGIVWTTATDANMIVAIDPSA